MDGTGLAPNEVLTLVSDLVAMSVGPSRRGEGIGEDLGVLVADGLIGAVQDARVEEGAALCADVGHIGHVRVRDVGAGQPEEGSPVLSW